MFLISRDSSIAHGNTVHLSILMYTVGPSARGHFLLDGPEVVDGLNEACGQPLPHFCRTAGFS